MIVLQYIQAQGNALLGFLLSCTMDLPMNAPVCVAFWTYAMLASFAFAALILAWMIHCIVNHKRKWRAALAAQEERERINTKEIENVKWRGEELDMPEGDLADAFRQALKPKQII